MVYFYIFSFQYVIFYEYIVFILITENYFNSYSFLSYSHSSAYLLGISIKNSKKSSLRPDKFEKNAFALMNKRTWSTAKSASKKNALKFMKEAMLLQCFIL